MTGFNHTLAGCIIAVLVPAPLVPFVAFASHFLLDMTPHFGQSERFSPYTRDFKLMLVADAILCFSSLGFAVVLFPSMWLILAIGAFFATLPDFMSLLEGRVLWLNKFFHFATVIQWGERPYGWIFDVLYASIFVSVLLSLAATG